MKIHCLLADLLLFAVEANEPTTIIVITDRLKCIYGLSQLRLRGHKVILVSDTWPVAVDHRKFIEKGLRWREDIHLTKTDEKQERRHAPKLISPSIDKDTKNPRDGLNSSPDVFPERARSARAPIYLPSPSRLLKRKRHASLDTRAISPTRQRRKDMDANSRALPVPPNTDAVSTKDAKESIISPSPTSQDSEFNPLIVALRKLHKEGMHRIELQELLQPLLKEDPLVFGHARIIGQQRLTKYIRRAQVLGVVSMTVQVIGKSRHKYVRLTEAYIEDEEVAIVSGSGGGRAGLSPFEVDDHDSETSVLVEEEIDESLAAPVAPSSSMPEATSSNPLVISPEHTRPTLVHTLARKGSEKLNLEPTKPSPGKECPEPSEIKSTKPDSLAKQKDTQEPKSSKLIPEKFKVLVNVLRELRKKNVYEINRSKLYERLLQQDKHVFDYLSNISKSFSKMKTHANEASDAGIVNLQVSGKKKVLVQLRSTYW